MQQTEESADGMGPFACVQAWGMPSKSRQKTESYTVYWSQSAAAWSVSGKAAAYPVAQGEG